MKVTIYTTSMCAICHSLMEWLDSEGQPYERIIVDEDEKGMQALIEKSGGAAGVPFTIITDDNGREEGIFGFDRIKMRAILGM